MAANKSQGNYLTLFLAALTALCAGLAYFGTAFGKLFLILGALGVGASLVGFLKIKPLEGLTALKPSPLGMKLAGASVSALGWVLTLLGLHLTQSTGGRIFFALLGISVTLSAIVFILPAAFNKNAVWKARSEETSEAVSFRATAKSTTTLERT